MPWNNVSRPSGQKTSLPRLKNKDFTKSPYGNFFKGVIAHDSCQQLEFFPLLPHKQSRPWNNVSLSSGYKTSLPRLKNKDFTKSPYGGLF